MERAAEGVRAGQDGRDGNHKNDKGYRDGRFFPGIGLFPPDLGPRTSRRIIPEIQRLREPQRPERDCLTSNLEGKARNPR